jgi:2-methylcitrate dehydratase PrpD
MDEMEILARHVSAAQFEDLSAAARRKSALFVMDLLGVALAGSSAPGCQTVVDQMKALKGPASCTVIANGFRLPAMHAAFANSTLAHALDYDDTHFPADVHATASIIPAALAVAEEIGGVSGKTLMTAVAAGVDVAARLGLALKPNMHDGWVPASVFGGFGSVASVARVSNLDAEQTRNAFGIFFGQASGSRQGLLDGALSKRMQPAFAAMQAIYATRFAQAGISGARNIMSGKYGLTALYAGGAIRRDLLLEGLGKRSEV